MGRLTQYRGLFIEEPAYLEFIEMVKREKHNNRKITNTIIFQRMMDAYKKDSQTNTTIEKEIMATTF